MDVIIFMDLKTDILVEVQIISMIQFHFPQIDIFLLINMSRDKVC